MPQLAPERVLEIRRVTFLQITDIDVVTQQYRAHVYIEVVIQDGAADERLANKENTFTEDKASEWTVVPSALWYIENQLHISNSLEQEVREVKVIQQGNDLVLIKRVFGLFYSVMDLHHFPVDSQDLTLNIECQCAVGGPFPVKFVTHPERTTANIFKANFMPTNMWVLGDKVDLVIEPSTLDLGASSKTYPAFKVRMHVLRKWAYYFFNVAVPMEVLTLLSILIPPCIPQSDSPGRLSVTLALTITAAAYKFAIAFMVPPVAYLTLIDRFVMALSLVLLLCAVQNAVLGIRQNDGVPIVLVFSSAVDTGSSIALLVMWVLLHLYYWLQVLKAMRLRRLHSGDDVADQADQLGIGSGNVVV